MRAITVAQSALFAAIAMALLTGSYLVDNLALLQDAPVLVLLGSLVPGVVWTVFFFAVHRGSSPRTVAWITLVFAVLLEGLVVYLRFQRSVGYWTPFGSALSLSGWLLRLGWAVFLIAFALAPEHASDNSRMRRTALLLAIISTPSALITAYNAWNNWLGLLFDDIPRQAFWRVLITPALRTMYWLSQILFLWTVWKSPLRQSCARLAPQDSPSPENSLDSRGAPRY